MAVPGAYANYLRNTTGGAFSAQTQGGTVLSNTTTGDVITKALALLDNAADFGRIPYPVASATSGSIAANIKAQGSNGTFAWDGGTAQGERFTMMGYSTKLGNYANTTIQQTGAEPSNMVGRPAIAQFVHDYGADTTSLVRANRYSYTGFFNNGNKITSRHNFMNAAGTAIADPSTLTGNNMWAPGGATRNGVGALARFTDAAANGYVGAADVGGALTLAATGLRNTPGRLVMKGNFIDLNTWTKVKVDDRPDFYLYKPITG